ncbi:hypothetical protein F5876DRAFT_71855 [Lentinula aff. lateritia]|uniref:Uncharacterized protein n=1 Tax=Lentinula aff. lateritia TaxID=2804960 RepID=A0ACC1UES2_9AGAR|nr:hypothetical protein F5876DRAFT_71855 [Lentinula aff. lateritia]
MGEKVVTRPWTQKDDDLLRDAVAKYGMQDNWQAVASEVPGRDNKACRKRWLHSLSPTVKKSPWTVDEDYLLLSLLSAHGPKWSIIARQIEGRTDDACSKRYSEALDPTLKKDEWTSDEEAKLLQVYSVIGGKWKEIGSQLQRSSLACRNRFKVLQRKKKPIVQTSSLTAPAQNEFESGSPYYPPGSYPLFPPEDVQATFQEPTLEVPPTSTLPPFQYSSSSLSSALEERPPISQHSPNFEVMFIDSTYDHTSGSSATPSPFTFAQEFNDGTMLLDDLSDPSHYIMDRNALSTFYFHHNDLGLVPDDNGICPTGPSRMEEYLPAIDTTVKSPPAGIPSALHDQQVLFNESPSSFGSPELSYPSSPLGQSGASSSTSSPGVSAPAELPFEPPSLQQSLLFSSSVVGLKESARSRRHNQPTRLSALLPFSDGSLHPYACGHAQCWPADASTSASCFPTARELFEHSKIHKEPEDEKPYRCALPGCNKFWKSLNGLQYHLQLSSAHFQQAITKTFSSQRKSNMQPDTADGVDSDTPDHDSKRYVCDRPNCFKSYKNASGLRYHKRHGHPKTMPMQLDNVPPALARDLPSRTRKMRKKHHNPSTVATAA